MKSQSNENVKAIDEILPDSAEGLNKEHIVQQKGDLKQIKVSIRDLFRFASKQDYILMIVGSFFSLANGATMPLFALLWGGMLDSFSDSDLMVQSTKLLMRNFILIGIGVFISGWIMIACWMITGERQAIECRKQYLQSLLRQEIGWYDLINQAELSSQFSSDTMAFQGAISDKIPIVLYVIAMAISGLIVAFIKGWLMTFVLFSTFPVIIFSMYLYMKNIQNKNKRQQQSYRQAGGKAEQALNSIKTVKMMNGEIYESTMYDRSLEGASEGNFKFGLISGASQGAVLFAMLSAYALGFWFGSNCVAKTGHCRTTQEYTSGAVFSVFFAIVIVGFNTSLLPPSLKKIAEGQVSAKRIFEILDRKPLISNPNNGVKPQNFRGIIKFENVTFSYPKNKDKVILSDISFTINVNKTSFVGESGCGKSTIMQLIMRFYDPDQGKITLDGYDLREIDLVWLRSNIGYVGQEPVLFAMSIRENLLYANENASEDQLIQALKKAQAWDFVKELEDGLDTYVGFGGGQISGGQKQRIAIARAILKDPKILLLDEATSALDRRNEKNIQKTLQKISETKMSLTIAHRVKTVMNSDIIFVISNGKVMEAGSFQELQRFKGIVMNEDDVIDQTPQTETKLMGEEKKEGFISFKLGEEDFEQSQKKLSKEQIQKKEKEELLEVYQRNTFSRIFAYTKGRRLLFLLGIIVTALLAAVYPVFTIILPKMIVVMFKSSGGANKNALLREANLYSLVFFLLGLAGLILAIFQSVIFIVIGDEITMKIRSQVFLKLIKLPISWHEKPKNNVGSSAAQLSTNCLKVKELTTTTIYVLFQIIFTLLISIIIALAFEWRTALVSLALTPFIIAAGAIRMAFRSGSTTKSEEKYKDSSNIIMESMTNIRTVCSFGYENIIYKNFSQLLNEPLKLAVKSGILSGFFYGLAQLIMFISISIIFYLGAIFVQNNGVKIENMFVAIFAIFFGAMTVGNNSQILPDMADCKIAAGALFLILDTEDEEQMQERQKSKMLKKEIKGDICFKNISFKYETRNEYLFRDFSLKIQFGQKSAFVGTSGCGKSTIFSLLLRFYEVEVGEVLLDGVDIKDYDIHHLRSEFGVVSQEPVLFNTSFKENIKYNLTAEDSEIHSAASMAHAADFIEGKEKIEGEGEGEGAGYDRQVGIKGSHISGGQKQRVAIARTILRKPNILLLDEATSALDSANEEKVQKALDEIMQKKTTISIAHRLDTIRNSKTIFLFDKGRVVEEGSYADLMAKKGYFYNLDRGLEFK